MLVYANHLSLRGPDAKEAIFKAIGGWLKEQLGFGLRPDELMQDGEFRGYRGEEASWLRVYATRQEQPQLCAWVLKSGDETVHGRQWITELGLKTSDSSFEFSCVVKTDEQSTLVASAVTASRPRVIRYVVNNIQQANDAHFAPSTPGMILKSVGQDRDSFRGLLAEIERKDRDFPLVLISPTMAGEYLLNPANLQNDLFGLAQVVKVVADFNSYEMEEVLGRPWSAWAGAANILHIPKPNGFVRGRFFLSDTIDSWGDTQHDRISQLLAWVTNNTNVIRLRKRISPEGVMQLALRRRLQAVRAKSEHMDASQLREELDDASRLVANQAEWISVLEGDNSTLVSELSNIKERLQDAEEASNGRKFEIQSLKSQLTHLHGSRASNQGSEALLGLACRTNAPTPLECIDVIESLYGNECCFLDSARDSAGGMNRFLFGRQLVDMLRRLVTEYRNALIQSGDSTARLVFGKNEYAATESETVRNSKEMRRARTFEYEGEQVEMFRHLKIGVDDDIGKTIRVHFHWDSALKKIVIGYCGEHLPVVSR